MSCFHWFFTYAYKQPYQWKGLGESLMAVGGSILKFDET